MNSSARSGNICEEAWREMEMSSRAHSLAAPLFTLCKELCMDLGAFSISLAVKDLEASKRFYEKFGFKVFAGDASQNWLILKNGAHTIGLFKGCSRRTSSPSTQAGTATPVGWPHSQTSARCSAS
jgi:hypothetical protein